MPTPTIVNSNTYWSRIRYIESKPTPPQTSEKGRELEALTASAADHGFVLKVAVVRSPTDLGSVPQLYGRAEKYAKFLRTELTWVGFATVGRRVIEGLTPPLANWPGFRRPPDDLEGDPWGDWLPRFLFVRQGQIGSQLQASR